MHLRGPMNISQLAVYQLPSEASELRKRDTVPFYNRRRVLQQRDNLWDGTNDMQPLDEWTCMKSANCSSITTVTSTLTVETCASSLSSSKALPNTTTVSSPLPCLPTLETASTIVGPSDTPSESLWSSNCTGRSSPAATQDLERHLKVALAPTPGPASDTAEFEKRAAAWDRVAYYTSAAPAQTTGITFLANLGDTRQSGTFDYAFGNSLSFVTPAGDKVSHASEPFDGTLETSEYEIAVFADKECDLDCPYWRPNATSHYAWAGSSKAFFIEFQMDHSENHGSDYGLISDAPAWWFLNAAIPRILQYGSDRNNIPCSCWSTGCGEFDAFEVLGKGEERAKSTMHRQGNLEGGDSNYFKRPVGETLKFAVVWHFPHITVRALHDGFEFANTLTEDQIDALVAYDPDSWVHSMFPIGD